MLNAPSHRPIYLDYASTTPIDDRVAKKMLDYMTYNNHFGNPASNTHQYGWDAEKAISFARAQVASIINASEKEIIFTSGATESNNLAIKGAAYFYQNQGKHIITVKTEHHAVLDVCDNLAKAGFEITYLNVDSRGLVDPNELSNALRPDTILVSIMHVNNEIGVIQDIQQLGDLVRSHGALFHVDAAQSVGKLPIDLKQLNVDLMSLASHKIYGPKGIGALYVRQKPRARIKPLIHGGGHQQGLRSGTLAVHQIVGMGEAFHIAKQQLVADSQHCQQLRDKLWNGLKTLSNITLNSDLDYCAPNILNVSFNYVDSEALIMALRNLAVSTGSACTSTSIEPSHVLLALGRSAQTAHSTIRFSVGRYTTDADIDIAIKTVITEVNRLRELSPLWHEQQADIT